MQSIKPRNLIFIPIKCIWKHIPSQIRRLLERMGVKNGLGKMGLRYEYTGVWQLSGVLKGFQICIEDKGQYQYIKAPYEPYVCDVIERIVKPGWICADVGAHIGYITLLLGKVVGKNGKVISFEVVPKNAKLLRKNVELNNFTDRVIVEKLAVTDGANDKVKLSQGRSSFESKVQGDESTSSTDIQAISLDNYFHDYKRLDLIKMDIEGGEVLAVKGMKRLLAITQPVLILEIHKNGRSVVDDLISAGYVFYDLNFRSLDIHTVRFNIRHCIAVPQDRFFV